MYKVIYFMDFKCIDMKDDYHYSLLKMCMFQDSIWGKLIDGKFFCRM